MTTSITGWIRKHTLITFFCLSYGLMFGSYALYLNGQLIPYPAAWFIGAFSPTISALLISWVIGGPAEVKRLLAGFTRWRVGLRWYLAAAFLFVAPLAVALGYNALGYPVPGPQPGLTFMALVGQILFTLASGPASEEAGWRGFALPRLQSKYSALVSSLVLGLIWAGWHIPLYFLPGSSQQGIPFPIYVVLVVTIGFYLTWLFNNTGGSLIITVLAHFFFNLDGGVLAGTLGLLPPMVLNMVAGPLLALVVIVVVIVFGPRHFSKRPLAELPIWSDDETTPARAALAAGSGHSAD